MQFKLLLLLAFPLHYITTQQQIDKHVFDREISVHIYSRLPMVCSSSDGRRWKGGDVSIVLP